MAVLLHVSMQLLLAMIGLLGAAHVQAWRDGERPTQVRIVAILPHNTSSFTEGLLFHNGSLIESTGLRDHSVISEYEPQSPLLSDEATDDAPLFSPVLNEFRFDKSVFGEGVACIGEFVYALTYKAKQLLVLSRRTFKLMSSYPLETETGEGWGMTTDGFLLIVSDGSNRIQFYDPQQEFKLVRAIDVKLNGKPVVYVNELEFVNGEILANVWFENHVLRINPANGHVLEVIDLRWMVNMVPNVRKIQDKHMRANAVMNGIAYNPANGHLYLTGKLWDSIFEVEFSYLRRFHSRQRHVSHQLGRKELLRKLHGW